MRIILTGGGTGGHIIPNIAVIEKLRESCPEAEILYLGSSSGVDRGIVGKFGIPFKGIMCGKLRRYFSWENLLDFFKIPIGVVQAFLTISKFRPEVIFSKGGFVSVPVVIGGWVAGRRIIVHESDVVPGLANKISGHFAKEICVAFPETVKYFKHYKATIHVVGNPVRKQIANGLKGKGYEMTKFNRELPIVMVIGGSQGANQLNVMVWRNLKRLLPICQIIHICGPGKKGAALDGLELKNYCQFDFLDGELPHLYSIADLVVSRAGANSLAEIALLKKPSVLLPLSRVASRGDQIENAKVFKKRDVAVVLNTERLTADDFFSAVSELVKSPKRLEEMSRNFENFESLRAEEEIVKLITKED